MAVKIKARGATRTVPPRKRLRSRPGAALARATAKPQPAKREAPAKPVAKRGPGRPRKNHVGHGSGPATTLRRLPSGATARASMPAPRPAC